MARKLDRSRKPAATHGSTPDELLGLSVRSDALAILANDLGASGLKLDSPIPLHAAQASDEAIKLPGAKVGELLANGAPRPSAVQIFAAYAQAVERSGDAWLGLRLGAARGPEWLGPLGTALGNMPTLSACIELAQRLIGMLVDGQRLELHGDPLRKTHSYISKCCPTLF